MTSYEQPKAELGEWVLFRQHEGADQVPAMVSKVSQRTLTLWAISPGYGGNDKFSVHHVTDPGLNEFPEWKTYGTWEKRASKEALVHERMAAMEKRLLELENRNRQK